MPYIGNTVQNQGFTPAIDYFSGNGSTVTFTLSRPVLSVAQMIVAIDNVIQNPSSAFTVSGSSITFTSAPLSGTNNIWVEYTSLITTYAAISQDPSVIGDITASGGYLSTGDFGNSYIDGTIVDYVTGNARITTGPVDDMTFYHGGSFGRSEMMSLYYAGGAKIYGTTALTIPVGTTAQRPGTPATGMIRMNTTTGFPEWYDTSSSNWIQFNKGIPYSVTYLVVAGGGGTGGSTASQNGGSGGGGGGGLLSGTFTATSGTTYTATVGAGGSGGSGNANGTSGANSTLTGITAAIGGGYGSSQSNGAGSSGGSGGGGGWAAGGGGAGTSGQGNSGGGASTGGAVGGGGGGGSTGAGQTYNGTGGNGGAGGAGTTSSITGSAVGYAGGGGGGGQGGAGGSGGSATQGGGAGVNSGNGNAGTANTGGGGGGTGSSSTVTGGNGGSGVIILSIPTVSYTGITTGSPTITTSGSNTIIKFTASGSYTA